MGAVTIRVGGRDYPWLLTMGTFRRFAMATGREFGGGAPPTTADAVAWAWAGTVTGCKAAGVEFATPLDDFADALLPEDFAAWSALMEGGGGEKKAAGAATPPA